MSCVGVGHDRLGECIDRAVQCVIYAGAYKAENHRCGMTDCTVKMGKICTPVTFKCANCRGNHQATTYKCPARLKVQAEAWREKSKKLQAKDKQPTVSPTLEEELEKRSIEIDLDTTITLWAKSPGQQSLELSSFGDEMPEDSQDK